MPFCLTFFSLTTLTFAFAVPRFLCLSPSPAHHRCLHQVRYCSLSRALVQALVRSGSLFLTRSHSLFLTRSHSLFLTRSRSLFLTRSRSLFLIRSRSLFLTRSRSLFLIRSRSLFLTRSRSLFVARSRYSSVCVSLSLSLSLSLLLSLSLSNISIQDIPSGSKYEVNLPLIIASTTTECLCSWVNDLQRNAERVLRFFLASHVPKKSYLQIISIVK